MNWQGTVMDELEMRIVLNKASWESPTIPLSYHYAIAKAQAEISFKAGFIEALNTVVATREYDEGKEVGIKEVVDYVTTYMTIGFPNDTIMDWQEQLKRWGK